MLEEIDNPSVLAYYLIIAMFLGFAIVPVIWAALEGGNYLVWLALNFPVMLAFALWMIWDSFVRRPRKVRVFEDGVELVFANSKERFVPWDDVVGIQVESHDSLTSPRRKFGAGRLLVKKSKELPFADQEPPHRYDIALDSAARLVRYCPDKLDAELRSDRTYKTWKEQ